MNLILDPLTHAPHLKFLIPNSLYYTRDKTASYPNGHYSSKLFEETFKFNFIQEENLIDSKNIFKNIFIILPVLSTEKKHQGDQATVWIELFNLLFNRFVNKVTGKVIIFDNHDADYNPTDYLSKFNFKHDIIFKRTCSNRNKLRYQENIYTYPFIMCTINDPMYNLFNTQLIKFNSNKINKIFWAGSLFKHDEEWDNNNISEHCDRTIMLNSISSKTPNIVDINSVPYSLFLSTISSYKYALDLRGASRLNKRLYEILTTDTLVFAERIDVIWPFDEGDKFSEECFFSDATELYNNYLKLENNNDLYKKCLENQKYLVKKYFNNKWLWEYIQNIIK
jgi:hypothetical protein